MLSEHMYDAARLEQQADWEVLVYDRWSYTEREYNSNGFHVYTVHDRTEIEYMGINCNRKHGGPQHPSDILKRR